MKILEFDIKKGIYHFETDGLDTEFHSHPVIEIVHSQKGTFTLETESHIHQNLSFAIINSNVFHRIISSSCEIELLMVESFDPKFFSSFDEINFNAKDIYTSREHKGNKALIEKTKWMHKNENLRKVVDDRVQKCLDILDTQPLEYQTMMLRLTSEVNLSESRISHLFKEAVGISLKKYLLWTKTKNAMKSYLQGENFTEVAHKHGFFDQAHLSNAFLKFLGTRPSEKYNSRIIQF